MKVLWIIDNFVEERMSPQLPLLADRNILSPTPSLSGWKPISTITTKYVDRNITIKPTSINLMGASTNSRDSSNKIRMLVERWASVSCNVCPRKEGISLLSQDGRIERTQRIAKIIQ
jgi:hypothetical protein